MMPNAGSARPQLKRGLMSSARIWLTRSSMVMSPGGQQAPDGRGLEDYRASRSLYACPKGLSRGRKSHGRAKPQKPWTGQGGQSKGNRRAIKLRAFSGAAIMACLIGEALNERSVGIAVCGNG